MNSPQAWCVAHWQSSPLSLLPTVITPSSPHAAPVHTAPPTDNLSQPQRAQTQTGLLPPRFRAAAGGPSPQGRASSQGDMKSHPPTQTGNPCLTPQPQELLPFTLLPSLTFCFEVCLFVFREKKKKYTINIRAFTLDSAEEQQMVQMNLLRSKAAGIIPSAVINTSLWMAKQTLQGTQAPGKEPHGESRFKPRILLKCK